MILAAVFDIFVTLTSWALHIMAWPFAFFGIVTDSIGIDIGFSFTGTLETIASWLSSFFYYNEPLLYAAELVRYALLITLAVTILKAGLRIIRG